MAVYTATAVSNQTGAITITETAMAATDTFAYVAGTGQRLKIRNPSAGILTVTIVGSAPTSVTVPNTGTTFSTVAGKTITVPVGGLVAIDLDKISAYLTGTGAITATGGTGGFAHITT